MKKLTYYNKSTWILKNSRTILRQVHKKIKYENRKIKNKISLVLSQLYDCETWYANNVPNQQKLLLIPSAIMNSVMNICLSIVSTYILVLQHQFLSIDNMYFLCFMQNWFVVVPSFWALLLWCHVLITELIKRTYEQFLKSKVNKESSNKQ